MGLIGGLIGAGVSAVGGIIGAGIQNKAYKQVRDMYNNRISEAKAHRDKVYYQDPTQSAENQAAVTEMRELLDEQANRSAATNAVTGGTNENVALQKQAAANSVGKVMRQQAAQGAAKKEQAYQEAEQQIDAYNQYLASAKMQNAQAKAGAIKEAAGGLSQAAGLLPW